jgi:hypothetical protein
MPMTPHPPRPRLTTEQADIVGQMNGWAFEHRSHTFEQIVARYIGEFPRTTEGRAFARACKKVFDRERAKSTTVAAPNA